MSSSDVKRGLPPSNLLDDSPLAAGPSEPPPPFEEIASTPLLESIVALPPQYTDVIDPIASNSTAEQTFVRPLAQRLTWWNNLCVLDDQLDEDPAFLEEWVRHMARQPMKPMMSVHGSHRESRHEYSRDANGRHRSERSTENVVDFDFTIDLTAFLFRDVRTRENWAEMRTVENHEKTYRGGIFRRRGDEYNPVKRSRTRRRRESAIDAEEETILTVDNPVALGTDGLEGAGRGLRQMEKPSLKEWCHRYCASNSVRSFEIERKVVGFDEDYFKGVVSRMVRDTGYMGDLNITFLSENSRVTVFSSCKTNEWRMIKWVRWVIILTLLVIIVWPYLFLTTRKWSVVVVDWWFSRTDPQTGQKEYVSLSENDILDFWGPAIKESAMRGRRGELTVADAVGARTRGCTMEGLGVERNRMEQTIEAVSQIQATAGWGMSR